MRFFLVILAFQGIYAHCPGISYGLDTLSEGVVEQNKCYSGFNICVLDTFYLDSLEKDLRAASDTSAYITLFKIQDFNTVLRVDTNWLSAENFQLDSIVTETGNIRVLANLKGNPNHGNFPIENEWRVPDTLSFQSLVDTQFIAFYNVYDSLANLNIHPNQDCLLEPTAYTIKEGRISKRGIDGVRMPGVSFSLTDFLEIIGYENGLSVNVPKKGFHPLILDHRKTYDLRGKVLKKPAPSFYFWL